MQILRTDPDRFGIRARLLTLLIPGILGLLAMDSWNDYRALQSPPRTKERSVIVFGTMEATLTPLMEAIEAEFAGVKVFSLPTLDHPQWGRHIELGVKGAPGATVPAFAALLEALRGFGAELGPEMVR